MYEKHAWVQMTQHYSAYLPFSITVTVLWGLRDGDDGNGRFDSGIEFGR